MNVVVRPTVPPPARAVLLVLILSILSASLASAQALPPIATHIGSFSGQQLGKTTAIVGDVDRDGCADYLIGVPYASPNGILGAGSALLYSGRTGHLLHRVDGTQAGEQRAWVAALGDVNRDTIPDYAVAAPHLPNQGFLLAGSIWVISGATNALLYEVRGPAERADFGLVMSGIGDADGDGASDFVVGCSRIDLMTGLDVGAVYVLRGVDGSTIRRFEGQFTGQRFGLSVAGVGDLDGDGLADVAVGAPSLEDPLGYGSVQLYSPASGASLGGIISNQLQDEMGWLVAGVGDVDGDGRPDWMTSAPWRDENGLTDNGGAWVFSGATNAPLLQIDGSGEADHWGSSIAGVGLVNNDTTPDFVVGSPDAHAGVASAAGAVIVYSGKDGAPLLQVGPDPAIASEGSWVAGGGDVDGDGNDDVMVSASLYSYPSDPPAYATGRVDIFGYAARRILARVDLIPGICPNVLPTFWDAVVNLLVLGAPGFDVSQLVPESVRLNGIPPVSFAAAPQDEAGSSAESSTDVCLCTDTGPDGYPDRAFQFAVASLTPVLFPRSPEGIIVNISGKLQDGTRMLAVACVVEAEKVPFVAPNPIRRGAESALFLEVPQGGASVRVTVHDVRGRLVRKIADARMEAGSHRIAWDGRRQDGVPAAGGVYFVRTTVGSTVHSNRVVLIP